MFGQNIIYFRPIQKIFSYSYWSLIILNLFSSHLIPRHHSSISQCVVRQRVLYQRPISTTLLLPNKRIDKKTMITLTIPIITGHVPCVGDSVDHIIIIRKQWHHPKSPSEVHRVAANSLLIDISGRVHRGTSIN